MAALSLNYFDVRNNDRLFSDTEGTWLAGGMDSVRLEAFAALTDYAREVTPPSFAAALPLKPATKTASRSWKLLWTWSSGSFVSDDPEQPKR